MKSIAFAALACATLAYAQTSKIIDASITENNPTSVAYSATLPTGTGIQGYIEGQSNANGTGVNFTVNFFQFPDASEGPFRKPSQWTLYSATSHSPN